MWKVLKTVFKRDSRHGARFIVVLIGLVIIFKAQLTELVQTIFSKITSESGKI
ncbi:Flp1 family type IVb pilin [Sellimonas intestinalis]|uniref:Flp1 family type IVb pilin n=1 Tax=Sellimonas intestinalis TaxID=1653434 RepID=UPI003AB300D9